MGEHEATRRLKNEFMSNWDGLKSSESDRVIVLAATNRPFDLDEAVLRRMPKRLLVDVPDAQARLRILKGPADHLAGLGLEALEAAAAAAEVCPSVSEDSATVQELRRWNREYGESGSRRGRQKIGFAQ
eukprot:tig00000215_g18588.t1